MYEKESIAANSLEYMNLDDISGGPPSYLSPPTTTSSFTPTTLARFESTFSDLSDDLHPPNSSGGATFFRGDTAPPNGGAGPSQGWGGSASQEEYSDGDESDGSSSNWSEGKRQRTGEQGGAQYSMTSPPLPAGGAQGEQKPPRKLPGPRPSRTLDQMTPLEAERRQRRRERNKNAAAKCRQRRLELTNELLAETENLEKESTRLEREIENLRRQKSQLEFVLEAHQPTCRGGPLINLTPLPPAGGPIKQERPDFLHHHPSGGPGMRPELCAAVSHPGGASAMRPSTLQIATTCRGSGFVPPTSSGSGGGAGALFSFDTSTSLTGLTPMLSAGGDLGSPSTYLALSPSALLSQ